MPLLDQPLQLILILFMLSIFPLALVLGSSFLKIAIVFSLLRNALGIQQTPPNIAIYGLALVLTLFTMAPIILAIQSNLINEPIEIESPLFIQKVERNILLPYREFLKKNTDPEQQFFFANIGHQIWPEKYHDKIPDESLLILLPAFTVSQLIEAFKIGLLLFLPFIAIDLIVSNVLLAMGMMMVSPMTISMPLKLLIFVLMGGWEKLLRQLILSFS
ncbi:MULTISPECIES: type III secretion system export apparatus subunit SctR [Providencia]|uniref:EscR/YscR/HrcR family type III secretion system export apparatus protein n=1 Tax=Providencia rettgeri TaxID=587 RepID=A0AAE3BWV3_PRORE|nr:MULTISPECIES: type III secretion system export apparatus subunit SctR [Providencia]MBC8654939.1 type III secretion system export apparatus subunit SctR [Providencia vermicola]EIL1984425.1 type III secretion system export apparatus subunit SctR [Providencia rettgeri]EIU7557783.1 type III secretion system export apparatus subunit SctR [Providencia rettgeri]EIU9514109.1 type III secretion system export apparatus subunit SctR [Providencia rettgeri]EJD6044320.1 type III secretion system export a